MVDLVEALGELHPHELPCAVAYQAVGGSEEYLKWVVSACR